MKQATGAAVTAVDVSPTAISIAASRFPDVDFQAAPVPPLHFDDAWFDLVVSAELLWYVQPTLERLLLDIQDVLVSNGHYLVIQQFYQEGERNYGREYMQSPEDWYV